jgi:hypothetical protein
MHIPMSVVRGEELHAWYAYDRVIRSTEGWLLTAGQQGMHQGLIDLSR